MKVKPVTAPEKGLTHFGPGHRDAQASEIHVFAYLKVALGYGQRVGNGHLVGFCHKGAHSAVEHGIGDIETHGHIYRNVGLAAA